MKLSLKDIKIGDTLICIDDEKFEGQLTKYNTYKIISKHKPNTINSIVIKSDDKTSGIYPLNNFITILQYRRLKINKLYENKFKGYN